jgi:YbgC/YbaW family acyl-CoA thioester hydrolase
MTAAPFRTQRRIEFADTDMAGIVHFSNFFRFMESAEVEFLRSRGFSVTMEWEGERMSMPRVSASCDFLRPVTFPDVVEISVRVLKIGRSSVTYGFEFFKAGELVARGQVSSVCCRILPGNQLESREIPAALREKLQDAGD